MGADLRQVGGAAGAALIDRLYYRSVMVIVLFKRNNGATNTAAPGQMPDDLSPQALT